jgi:hypothetical protein
MSLSTKDIICKAGLWEIQPAAICPICGAAPDSDCSVENGSYFIQTLDELRQAIHHIANASPEPPAGVTYRQRCEEFQRVAQAALIRANGG